MISRLSRPALSTWKAKADHWLSRDAPPHALALLRILFGMFQLLIWAQRIPIVQEFSSNDGLILPHYGLDASPLAVFVLTPPAPGIALLLMLILFFALCCVTVGIATRTACLISLILYSYEWHLSIHMFGTSYDRLFMFTLALLACSGCDRAFSFAMWRKYRSMWAWEPTWILPQRLLALQISATYLGVGWQKIWLHAWQGGEVLSFSFIGRWGTPIAFRLVRLNLPIWIYDVAVKTTIYFECSLPFGLWIKRVRWFYFVGGAIFHTSITVMLDIWWFMILIPAYVVYFEPEELLAFLRRVSGRRIPLSPGRST